MYKAIIQSVAKQDIKEAVDWYNSKQKGLGKRFTVHLRQQINLIKQNPYISVVRYDDVRTAVLDIFPFMTHYSIDEANKLVIIYAILHTSRNPAMWDTRHDPDS